ncbi:DUF2345 domain-containing protein, partial [Montanilutibacter psychrotolerans]
TDQRIDVMASKKIVLQAGQTQVTLEGGDITFACPGNFTVNASEQPFKAGENVPAQLERLPDSRAKRFSVQFVVKDRNEEPVANFAYAITNSSGESFRGTTNENGETMRVFSTTAEKFDLRPDTCESESQPAPLFADQC